jgi:prevent-host-death family protein
MAMGKKETVRSGKFQRNVARYLEEVLKGTTILITRWGRPIAELRPVEPIEESEQQGKREGVDREI